MAIKMFNTDDHTYYLKLFEFDDFKNGTTLAFANAKGEKLPNGNILTIYNDGEIELHPGIKRCYGLKLMADDMLDISKYL